MLNTCYLFEGCRRASQGRSFFQAIGRTYRCDPQSPGPDPNSISGAVGYCPTNLGALRSGAAAVARIAVAGVGRRIEGVGGHADWPTERTWDGQAGSGFASNPTGGASQSASTGQATLCDGVIGHGVGAANAIVALS